MNIPQYAKAGTVDGKPRIVMWVPETEEFVEICIASKDYAEHILSKLNR